jgi:hypothetical protein
MIEKTAANRDAMGVSDVRNSRAADAYRIALLQHLSYGSAMPK